VTSENRLFSVDAATGRERWRTQSVDAAAAPAVVDGIAYVGSEDGNL
jgi:outer membrane protein assembly factor BamB